MYISKAVAKRMLKNAGAGRIGDDAVKAFQAQLEKIAYGVAVKAVRLSKHAKRKTVEESDVKLAFQ